MTHKPSLLLVAALIVFAFWGFRAESAVRINGNQLVSGSSYHGDLTSPPARAVPEGAASAVPTVIVHNLGQAMLPAGPLNSTSGVSFGVGLGYDIGLVVYDVVDGGGSCLVLLTGDVNQSGARTSADIIALVNYVFKSGNPPAPCVASGDVNASGNVTSADIIYLVNYVFKGGAPPLNVCDLIPGTWSCP